MSQETENYLAHYGVKGMKWGKRKSSSTKQISLSRDPTHPDASTAKDLKFKAKRSGTDALSNSELQTAITRMNLEQQYSKLSPNTKYRGQKIAEDVLGKTGKQLASEYAKQGAKLAVEASFNAVLGAIKK